MKIGMIALLSLFVLTACNTGNSEDRESSAVDPVNQGEETVADPQSDDTDKPETDGSEEETTELV